MLGEVVRVAEALQAARELGALMAGASQQSVLEPKSGHILHIKELLANPRRHDTVRVLGR